MEEKHNLLKLGVTECLDFCPKQWEYEAQTLWGQLDYKPNPIAHAYAATGILTHYAIEQNMLGKTVEWDYAYFEESERIKNSVPNWMYNKIIVKVRTYFNNANYCIRSFPQIFDFARPEDYLVTVHDNVRLSGKPDLMSNFYIVDWKSGKYNKAAMKKAYVQCAGYDFILTNNYNMKKTDSWHEKSYVAIFLGDEPARVCISTREEQRLAMVEFIDNFISASVTKRLAFEGSPMRAKLSFYCTFCKWNGYCRGV